MTAEHGEGLFDGLVEGRTYQIGTSFEPSGSVRWRIALLGRLGPGDLADLIREDPDAPEGLRAAPEDFPTWNEVAVRVTGRLPDGDYRTAALAWLAEVAPDATDCVLILPDGNERINRG